MRRLHLALPLLLAALATGCGASGSSAGDFEGEEANVAEAVESIQSAGEARDAQKLCDELLAKALRDAIAEAGSSCEVELDKSIRDADDFELEVADVTVQGDTATARVLGGEGDGRTERTFEFAREDGDWRATALGDA